MGSMNTNSLTQLIQSPAAWHGLTMAHAFVLAVAAWITHANWPRIMAAGSWIASHGGVIGILAALLKGQRASGQTSKPTEVGAPK